MIKMDKHKIYLLGCSFTDCIKGFNNDFFSKFKYDDYDIINLAYISRSNFQILEDIKSIPNNSNVIIQWSALTRPDGITDYEMDWNKELNKLAFSNTDPLKFLIDNFIKIVKTANDILTHKKIKSFQYIGWVQWNDDEIDLTTSNLLNELPINWFKTPVLLDVIPNTCWTYNNKNLNIKLDNPSTELDLWQWNVITWGGMSEWIRLNVDDMLKRYIAINQIDGYNDPHPSEYASEQFYKNIILPEISKMIM